MILNKLEWFGLSALVTGLVLTSAGVLARQESKPKAEPTGSVKAAPRSFQSIETHVIEKAEPTGSVKAAPGHEEADSSGSGQKKGRLQDFRSRQIIAKLEEPISMSFAAETPLDDVLKYIKQATTTPTFAGIPIYVDPVGLQEAERSLNSTVQIDLEGIPLRRTLQLVLSQLGLAYFVEDGMVVITSEDSADAPLPLLKVRPTPLLEKMDQAEQGDLPLNELEDLLKYVKTRAALLSHGLKGDEGATVGKRDSMEPLLGELRELIELLKAERQAKKAPEAK